MKAVFLQLTAQALSLTPAKLSKGAVVCGKKRVFPLPEKVSSEHPAELSRFAAQCLKESRQKGRRVILCLEDDRLVSREYLHLPAKNADLPAIARLEAEAVLGDSAPEYLVEPQEYRYADPATGKLKSVLYALPKTLVKSFQLELKKNRVRLWRIVPPISGLILSGRKYVTGTSFKNKNVALLDVSPEKTRLVIFQSGAPLFSHTFETVYWDILTAVGRSLFVSPLDAAGMIQQKKISELLGNDPDSQKQISTLLDAAANEILRNIRMVLSAGRLEISEILCCGSLSLTPGFADFCEGLAMDIPILNLREAGGNTDAEQFSLSGIPLKKDPGSVNFLRDLEKQREAHILNATVLTVVTLIMLGVMALEPLMYFHDQNRRTADKAALQNPDFNEVISLLDRQNSLNSELETRKSERSSLPFGTSASEKAVAQLVEKIKPRTSRLAQCSLNNETGLFSLSFNVSDFSAFHDVRAAILADKYFTVAIPFAAEEENTSAGTSLKCTVTLQVKDFKSPNFSESSSKSSSSSSSASASSSSSSDSSQQKPAEVLSDAGNALQEGSAAK